MQCVCVCVRTRVYWKQGEAEQQDLGRWSLLPGGERNINNLRYADDTTFMAEYQEELKSLLMKVKEESEKAGLNLSIQKMKIMATVPITSWQIEGETMETVRDFIFLDSRITADGDCNHEIKRCLLLGRKVMTNLDNILKSRDITLTTKVNLVNPMVFPVVMNGYESWNIKKAERQRHNLVTEQQQMNKESVPQPLYCSRVNRMGKIKFRLNFYCVGVVKIFVVCCH